MSYADITYADAYFNARLFTQVWLGSSDADKQKALDMGTSDIDVLSFAGDKTSSDQANEFPRNDEDTPDDILVANCEIAMARLDQVDPDAELDNTTVVSQAYASVRTTYNRDTVPEHIMAGIVSATAWRHLRPYLREPGNIRTSRAS